MASKSSWTLKGHGARIARRVASFDTNCHRPGEILTGTVADVRDFGVFVNLDGEPADTCTGCNGVGGAFDSAVAEEDGSLVTSIDDVSGEVP
jgi:DNA-directed RNA polymerase subunit E'/Rpb7